MISSNSPKDQLKEEVTISDEPTELSVQDKKEESKEEQPTSVLMKRFKESANSQKHDPVKTKMLEHLEFIRKNNLQTTIEEDAKLTFPLTHSKVRAMATQFLTFKLENGTALEKALYKNMTLEQFIERLLTHRPIYFFTSNDSYRLPSGEEGYGGFEKIGTDKESKPLVIQDYLSYDELKLAALLGIAGPTHFIPRKKGQQVQETAQFVALVGPRFEKPGVMEYQECVIDKSCTPGNGYGKDANPNHPKTRWSRMWAKHYGLPYFPSYKEAKKSKDKNIVSLKDKEQRYFNIEAYKQRIKLTIIAYLSYANQCAQEKNKKSYVRIPALGLGCWNIDSSPFLSNLMMETYREVLNTCDFPNISAIEFCRFPHVSDHKELPDKSTYQHNKNQIKIYYSPNGDFADKLPEGHKDDLLVSGFAWDGGSRIGNEFYKGMLNASVDPMAACGSTILLTHCYSHNPDNIKGDRLIHFDSRKNQFKTAITTSTIKENTNEDKKENNKEEGKQNGFEHSTSVIPNSVFKPTQTMSSNQIVKLSIAPSRELVVQFADSKERNKFLRNIGQQKINQKFVASDSKQYEKNPFGLTPVTYEGDDDKLYFPTYETSDKKEVAVDFISSESRTQFLKLLELKPDPDFNNHLVGGGQSKTTYGNGLITAYTGTDTVTGKNQNNVIFFPQDHLIFSEECYVEISAGKVETRIPDFLILS